jgi:hypothetical protein
VSRTAAVKRFAVPELKNVRVNAIKEQEKKVNPVV